MRRRLVAGALTAMLALGGCGDSDRALTNRAARQLQDQVAAVEYAIAGGEYDAARQGIGEVRATAIRLTDRGEIADARAAVILDAIDDVEVRLVRLRTGD